jgi:glycerol-3-phosphate dehydrogenase
MARPVGSDRLIVRDLKAAARREFDLVVIGGGIYGVSLLQEAARRGLSACLCEAADFGGGTSWNSLRIVHGGLRYLQTMDLLRFFQSVAARRRVARQFPALVRPLECLMPLYGKGLKRASLARMALLVNDVLSAGRNRDLIEPVRLPPSQVLDAEATRRQFPPVRTEGLEGAARWSDYLMVSSERIVLELLRDACRNGAVALNYAPALELVSDGKVARGVRIRDALSGEHQTIAARAVVNCSGPQVRRFARGRGGDAERLFQPSLAFNLMLDVSLPGTTALAVASPQPDAPILFLVPQRQTLLAGTMHLPRPPDTTEAVPTEAELEHFLILLNEAIPGLNVGRSNVRRVFAGLLPATVAGSAHLVKREILEDHGKAGGLEHFYSVSGVKFTTAAEVARRTLTMIGTTSRSADTQLELPLAEATPMLIDASRLSRDDASVGPALQRVVEEEAVQSLDDLILRRANWATTETDLEWVRERVLQLVKFPSPVSRPMGVHI